jgi:hypothetical protein
LNDFDLTVPTQADERFLLCSRQVFSETAGARCEATTPLLITNPALALNKQACRVSCRVFFVVHLSRQSRTPPRRSTAVIVSVDLLHEYSVGAA